MIESLPDPVGKAIEHFLAAKFFAVVGASNDPLKYGHKCYLCYLQNDLSVFPINPKAEAVAGNRAYPNLSSLPQRVESISIVTPPTVTERIVQEAITCGVKNIWMQPGAESQVAIDLARKAGLNVIAGGPCLLVALNYHGP